MWLRTVLQVQDMLSSSKASKKIAAACHVLPGNQDLHHSTEKTSKGQLKAAPAAMIFNNVNFWKWFLQQSAILLIQVGT